METKDNVGLLYNALKKQGFNDIGDENVFRNKMSDENNRKLLYDALQKEGFRDIGDYNTFNSKLIPVSTGNAGEGSVARQVVDEYDSSSNNNIDLPQSTLSPYVRGKGKDTQIFGVPYTEYQKMSPEEQSKRYSEAIEQKKQDEKNYFSNYISTQMGEIDKELNQKRDALPSAPGAAFIPSSASGAVQRYGNADNRETQDKYTSLHAAKNLLDDANNIVEESKKGDTGFISSLGRGFKDKFIDVDNWNMGLTDTAYSGLLRKAIEKEELGDELSPEESKLLDAAAVNMATQAFFSSDLSRGYKAGNTTAQSIPFMMEFAINPISSTGNAMAKGLLKYGLKRFGRVAASNVAKVAGRIVGDAAAAAGMTATSSLGRVAAGTNERMIGDVQAKVDNGEIKYAGRENGMDTGEALAKSAASNFLENQSEMFFNAFDGGGKMAIEALNKVIPGLSKLSNSEIVQTIGRMANNPMVKDIAKRTQFHGIFGEYAEEVYNNLANIPLGEMTFDQATDLDNNIDTFLGLAPTSAAFGLLGIGGMAKESYDTRRNLRRFANGLNEEDRTLFEELNQVIREGNSDIAKSFIKRTLADDTLTPEQKKDRVFAVQDMQREKVLGDIQQEQPGVMSEDIERNKISIYRDFVRADRKAKQIFPEEVVSQLPSVTDVDKFAANHNLNDTQKEAASAYTNAYGMFSMYQENVSKLRENVANSSREQAISDVERISNQDTGNVVQAKHKFLDNPVYLVGGRLSFGEDGLLDRDNSDDRVYYLDENGQRQMASADDFDSVMSNNPKENVIEMQIQDADRQFIQEEELSLNTPDIPEPERGDRVIIGNDIYLIEEQDIDVPGNVLAVKLDANGDIDVNDGRQLSLSPDEYYSAKESELWGEQPAEKLSLETVEKGVENAEQPIIMLDNEAENKISSQSDESNVSQSEPIIENPSTIPSDDKGNLLYHRTPVETTIEAINSEGLEADEIDSFVSANKEASAKLVSTLESKSPKMGTSIAKYKADKLSWSEKLSDARAQVDYWNSVSEEIAASRVQPGDKTAEAILSMGEPMTGEELAAAMLGTGRLPILYDSYKKETGGRNSEARGMVGLFASKANGGVTIEEAGELLMLADQENGTNFFDSNDPNAGRNAIIDVLSGARTRGDLFGYIQRNREVIAERERQAEYNAYSSWTEENFGMTPEDYEAYEEQIPSSIAERFKEFDENEFYTNIVNELDGEQGEIAGATEGSEVLQGEGVISPERIETSDYERGTVPISTESSGQDGVILEEARIDNQGPEVIEPENMENPDKQSAVVVHENGQNKFSAPHLVPGESVLDYAGRIAESKQIFDAEQEVDTNPTDAQKEAGNYKKGHVKVDGYYISIENPKGSERSGVDTNGQPWSVTMNNSYGYIRKTEGADGDHIDVFLSDTPSLGNVYVVDQVNEDGVFDEHKVMYGFSSIDEAKEAYLANYSPRWKGLGNITEVTKDKFKKWVDSSNHKTKPFSDYKSVKAENFQDEKASAALEVAMEKLEDIEQEWEDKILDYIAEHYPTQATVSNQTNSSEGVKEREAMKNDETLKRMRAEADAAFNAADRKVAVLFEKGNSDATAENASKSEPSAEKAQRDEDMRFREKDSYTGEEQSIVDKAKEDGSYMKAPNGKKTNLTDKQWVQVRTKAFKNWFGDWENNPKNASKAVDKNGEPLVVYHGTLSKSIERFRKDMIGSRYSYDESGFFFTDKENIAKDYSTSEFDPTVKGKIVPVYLNIRKPIVADNRWAVKNGLGNALKNMDSIEFWDNYQSFMLDEIEENKSDGAIINDGTSKMVVVFEPNQIKSATENSGEFSSSDDAIRLRDNSDNLDKSDVEKVLSAINSLSEALHTPIRMIRAVEELPDGKAKHAIERGRSVKAWYDLNTGEVSVYLPNINSATDAVKSVLHEVVGHKGLRDLFGAEMYDEIMTKLYKQLPADIQKNVSDVADGKYSGNTAIAMDEYLAEQAEKDETPSWWSRVVSSMRDFLREMGVDVTLTANDVKYLLWKSKNHLMKSDNGMDLISKVAADENMKERFHIGEYARTSEQEKADYDRASWVVSDFAQNHAGAANALVIRSRDMMRKQLEAVGVVPEDIGKYEQWFDDGGTVAFWAPKYNKILVLDTSASEQELNDYLWHESTHKALYQLDDYSDTVSTISDYVEREFPVLYSYVADMYKEDGDYTIREECVSHLLEYMAHIGRDKMDSSKVKLDEGPVRDAIRKLLDNINYGKRKNENQDGFREDIRGWKNRRSGSTSEERSDGRNAERGNLGATESEESGEESRTGEEVIRFRDETEDHPFSVAQTMYDEAVKDSFRNNFSEGWFDFLRSVQKLQDVIEKATGKVILGFENVYQRAMQLSSLNKSEFTMLQDKIMDPLAEHIAHMIRGKEFREHKMVYDDVDIYLNCKHGLERNEMFANRDAKQDYNDKLLGLDAMLADKKIGKDKYDDEINNLKGYQQKQFKKHRKRDYSGLTGIFDTEKVGLSNNDLEVEAEKYIKEFESVYDAEVINKLWDSVGGLTDYALDKSYKCGLIGKKEYEEIKSDFKHYVPLRGFSETTSGDIYDYISRYESEKVPQKILKKADGRSSRADNILATMMNMAHSSVVQGNKNLVKQSLMAIALNHRTSLLSISKQWYEKGADGLDKPLYPVLSDKMSADEQRKAIEDFEEEMKNKHEAGDVFEKRDGLKLQFRVAEKWEANNHCVRVLRGGKEYLVWVNGNPKAAQALNGDLNLDSSLNDYEDKIAATNRFLARMQTAYSPEFIVRNLQRDILFSNSTAYIKEGGKYWLGFNRNLKDNLAFISVKGKRKGTYAGIYSLYSKHQKGALNMSIPRERYFKEFVENGGETGYSLLYTVDDYKKRIDKIVKQANTGYGKVGKGIEAIGAGIEFSNKGVENACRFAAYMTSRERGRGVLQSVMDAKEISVNFNRKGSGKLGNRFARMAYTYMNPAVQSIYQLLKLSGKYPRRSLKAFGTVAALGFLNSFATRVLLSAFGSDDDDDKYDRLSPWKRRNNICVFAGDGFVTWQLPPELRVFYGIGEIGSSIMTGDMNHENAFLALMGQMQQLSPWTFVGENNIGGVDFLKTTIKSVVPTAVSFLSDAYLANENFLGGKITNAEEWNKRDPDWKRCTKGTNTWLIAASRWLNEATGGNDHKRGWLENGTAGVLNPGAIEYLFSSYLGGLGTFGAKLTKVGMAIAGDEDMKEFRNIPIASALYTSVDNDYSTRRQVDEAFRYYESEFEVTDNQIKGFNKDWNSGHEERAAQAIYNLHQGSDYKRWVVLKGYLPAIKKLEKAMYEAQNSGDKKKRDRIAAEIYQRKKNAIGELAKKSL